MAAVINKSWSERFGRRPRGQGQDRQRSGKMRLPRSGSARPAGRALGVDPHGRRDPARQRPGVAGENVVSQREDRWILLDEDLFASH